MNLTSFHVPYRGAGAGAGAGLDALQGVKQCVYVTWIYLDTLQALRPADAAMMQRLVGSPARFQHSVEQMRERAGLLVQFESPTDATVFKLSMAEPIHRAA